MWNPKTPARIKARTMAAQYRSAMSRVGRVTRSVSSPECMVGLPRESSRGSDKTVSVFMRQRIRKKRLHIVGIRSHDAIDDDPVRNPWMAAPEPAPLDPLDRKLGAGDLLPQRSREKPRRPVQGRGVLPEPRCSMHRDRSGERVASHSRPGPDSDPRTRAN